MYYLYTICILLLDVYYGSSPIQSAGEDFSCPAMTFTFNDNISEQNVSIGVEDDGFFEGTENFVVTLQSPVFGVQIEPAVVDITISDNEGNLHCLPNSV